MTHRAARTSSAPWLVLCALAGCGDSNVTTPPVDLATAPADLTVDLAPSPPPPDFRGRTVYEIFLRSFADSDGDGIGDLRGLTARLDYLNDGNPASATSLGVDAIWLMPIFPSPSTHGYDVTDYQGINPKYGTLADFDALIAAAHARGIKVVLDLVINHSSSKHPWFVDASGGKAAAKRGWYTWSDTDLKWSRPWDQADPWRPLNGAFYYGLFSTGMPDLNLRNAGVVAAIDEAAKFWLARGVDGYRLDAVRYYMESPDGKLADQPETHDYLKHLRTVVAAASPHAQLVGEAWAPLEVQAKYYGSGDELQLAFSFDQADAIIASIKAGDITALVNVLARAERAFPDRGFEAPFLSNHDQVRVMRQFAGDPGAARVAAATLFALPGTPFVYYGEEIGMLGGAGNDDTNKRTPMRWTQAAPGYGFTTGTPWYSTAEGASTDVATQQADPASLWQLYRNLIALRRTQGALQAGSATRLPVTAITDGGAAPGILALSRSAPGQQLYFVANYDTRPSPALALPALGARAVTVALAEGLTGPPTMSSGIIKVPGLAARGFAFLNVVSE